MIEKIETVLRAIATVIAIPLIAVLSFILFLALLLGVGWLVHIILLGRLLPHGC